MCIAGSGEEPGHVKVNGSSDYSWTWTPLGRAKPTWQLLASSQ